MAILVHSLCLYLRIHACILDKYMLEYLGKQTLKEVKHLPNIISSVRSVKSDAERRAKNFAAKSAVKTAARKLVEAIEAGQADEAKALLIKASKTIDTAAAKGVFHKNAAARKKSRLARRFNALAK